MELSKANNKKTDVTRVHIAELLVIFQRVELDWTATPFFLSAEIRRTSCFKVRKQEVEEVGGMEDLILPPSAFSIERRTRKIHTDYSGADRLASDETKHNIR